MEKNSLCKNMKKNHDFRVKGTSSWDHFGNYEGDLGFSWPPRSYICSFCKREFRSAQALGGHMNVHRRDRARLRQSPTASDGGKFSPLNLNPNPNPSFNSNPSSCTNNFPSCPPPFSSLLTRFPNFTSKIPPLGPLPNEMMMMKPKATKVLFGVERCEKGRGDLKKSDFVRLDLEIGLISDSKEELDLELRLGYT